MLRCVVPVLALRMPFVCCYAASPSPVHWGMRACRVGRSCSRLRSPQRSPRYRASSCGFVLRLGLDSRCVVARWGCVAASLHCPNMGRARRFLVRVGGLGDAALLCALCHFGDCGLFRLRGVSRARPSYGGRCFLLGHVRMSAVGCRFVAYRCVSLRLADAVPIIAAGVAYVWAWRFAFGRSLAALSGNKNNLCVSPCACVLVFCRLGSGFLCKRCMQRAYVSGFPFAHRAVPRSGHLASSSSYLSHFGQQHCSSKRTSACICAAWLRHAMSSCCNTKGVWCVWSESATIGGSTTA